MKRLLAVIAAAIGIAAGASADTIDLKDITHNTKIPTGTVLTGTHGGNCSILIASGAVTRDARPCRQGGRPATSAWCTTHTTFSPAVREKMWYT